ncbi:MAG: CPBP family intramembrane metalloprotease [Methanomassiliicoccales archaeon]|nr:MAG: CPBP family intramembrane metalloprotease [Methanomassiliicoccales archaeon]
MRDKLNIALPAALIVTAEAFFFNGGTEECLEVHLLNIFLCVILAIFRPKGSDLLVAFVLISLLRVLNVGMPTFFDLSIYFFPFIYLPVIIAAYLLWRADNIDEGKRPSIGDIWKFMNGVSASEVPTFKLIFIPLATLIALFMAFFEYAVLRPDALVPDMSLASITALLVVMVFFVGFGEELVFRTILQTRAQERMGAVGAVVFSALMFSVMHSGYGSLLYLAYVFIVGLVLGVSYLRTRNLIFIALIHGLINFFLFSFLPKGWFLFD